MDKLKNFINTRRDEFDKGDLPEGHFERFEHRLPTARRKHLFLHSIAAAAVAASLALLIFFQFFNEPETDPQVYVCETRDEIEDLKMYYNMQINDVITRMEDLYEKDQTSGGEKLLDETKKVLTDNYMFEETVLPKLPCSSDALFAITLHYNSSLESLSFMLKQMEHITEKNDNN